MYQGNGVRKGWRDGKNDQNPNTITPVCRLHDASSFSYMTDIQNGWMQGRMRSTVQVFCRKSGSTECEKLLRLKTERVELKSSLFSILLSLVYDFSIDHHNSLVLLGV
jgi:hypothetical protein